MGQSLARNAPSICLYQAMASRRASYIRAMILGLEKILTPQDRA